MPSFSSLLYLLIFLPLAGVLINTAGIRVFREKITSIIACAAVGSALLFTLCLLPEFLSLPQSERTFSVILYQWFAEGALEVNIGLLLDSLSLVMVLVVLFVGFLIHIYS
ncbi:MAG TPA: hypothetical protein PKZ12_08675, partial [Smithellaceae bacterium]|nr:hypothetical protein [Smithellaceae bacterium]